MQGLISTNKRMIPNVIIQSQTRTFLCKISSSIAESDIAYQRKIIPNHELSLNILPFKTPLHKSKLKVVYIFHVKNQFIRNLG